MDDVGELRVPDDDGVLAHPHAGRRPSSLRTAAFRSAIDGPSLLMAVGVGSLIGIALGWWCRSFAYSNSINGVLANLGAPWVIAAFIAGAVRAGPDGSRSDGLARPHLAAGFAGALAGTIGLVVATIVYYGPARTGSFDFHGAAVRTVFWTMVSVAAGVVFGAAGALWRVSSSDTVRATSLVGLGTVIAGEAGYLIAVGATGHDTFALNVVLVVAVAGMCIPLLLGRRPITPLCVALVPVLAVPATVAAGVLAVVAVAIVRVLRALPV